MATTPIISSSMEIVSRSLVPRLSWTASSIRPATTSFAQHHPAPQQQQLRSRSTATAAFARNAWASRRASPSSIRHAAARAFSTTAPLQKDHHFDTLKFVQSLEASGFSKAQSESIMRVLDSVIEESIQNLTRTMVLREDQEKATYTQKVDFAKLRSELLTADSSESALTRASHERLTNDLAKLNNRLRDEVQRTQASVRLDLNLEKGRIREEANSQDLKIKETETRIEQESAALRERLEAVKFSTLQWLMGVCTGTAAIILGVWRLLM